MHKAGIIIIVFLVSAHCSKIVTYLGQIVHMFLTPSRNETLQLTNELYTKLRGMGVRLVIGEFELAITLSKEAYDMISLYLYYYT